MDQFTNHFKNYTGYSERDQPAEMFESLKIIFTEAQSLRGDDRDRVIIQRLKTLEAAT